MGGEIACECRSVVVTTVQLQVQLEATSNPFSLPTVTSHRPRLILRYNFDIFWLMKTKTQVNGRRKWLGAVSAFPSC